MADQQSLFVAVTEMHAEIVRFHQHWIEQNAKHPRGYPLNLPAGEWPDQFKAFIELEADHG